MISRMACSQEIAPFFGWKYKLLVGLVSLIGLSVRIPTAKAQIAGDMTLPAGENTLVNSIGDSYEITGGATQGNNLFHSFESFSLSNGEEAFFNHSTDINTILGRVTGGGLSEIDGRIRTPESSIADIFFINPQGIIFGPNASLDIGGSFIASTAAQIVFADKTEFSAVNPQTVFLTVSRPVGLILGENSGRIENQSLTFNPEVIAPLPVGLQVPQGQSILLVSNGIDLRGGSLTAFSGRIDLASLGPGSSVNLISVNSPSGSGWRLDDESLESLSFQDIQLSNEAYVNTDSDLSFISNISGNPNGSIHIWGRHVVLDNSFVLNDNFGTLPGEDTTIIAAERLQLSNGAWISVRTFSDSHAGDLTIGASDGAIELRSDSRLLTESNSFFPGELPEGNAGDITLNAMTVRVMEGSSISTTAESNGLGGNLTINGFDSVEISGAPSTNNRSTLDASTVGTRAAGKIQINTGTLLVQDGGQIASVTLGSGNGSRIGINATESITVTGQVGNAPSRIFSSTGSEAIPNFGNAGSVEIETRRLVVEDGAAIFTSTNGPGQGGTLAVTADEVVLKGEGSQPSGLFARTESIGASGELAVFTDRLLIEDGARIDIGTDDDASTTITLGTVRDASITARTITLNNGQIRAESRTGGGGNLIFDVQDYILLRNNSLISANAETAQTGNPVIAQTNTSGGNITLNAESGLVVAVPEENSDITANAVGGQGGEIRIFTQGLLGIERRELSTSLSDITATSESGRDGTIQTETLGIPPDPELIPLPLDFLNASQLVAQGCEQFSANSEARGSFYVLGRGGITPLASETLGSDDVVDDLRLPDAWANESPITEAQDWFMNDQGEVILTANPLPELTNYQCWR